MSSFFFPTHFKTINEWLGIQNNIFPEFNDNQKACLKALHLLIQDPEGWKVEFAKMVATLSLVNMDEFFFNTLQVHIEKIDLMQLKQATNQHNVSWHAFEKVRANLPPSFLSEVKAVKFAGKTWWPVQFINNFVDAFITSFSFFDGREPPTSIYEKHVLIQIYYRFFQIPLAIACLLQPLFFTIWKVYAATIGVLGVAGMAVECYKYLRPFPQVIPHCENIEEAISKVFPGEIGGLEREIHDLVNCLNVEALKPHGNFGKKNHCNPPNKYGVMLIAGTGNGKTTLVYKLHQMIKRNQVPSSLKNKKIVVLKGSEIMAKTTIDFGDKIKDIRYKLKGFEKETIIFIDEIQVIATDPVCLEKIKDFIRLPGFQFVVATTHGGLKKIQQLDFDDSFYESFDPIYYGKWHDLEIQALLEEMVFNQANDIEFDGAAVKKIIELSNSFREDLPQPRKAIKLLERIIKICRTNYHQCYSEELSHCTSELKALQFAWSRKFSLNDAANEEKIKILSQTISDLKQIQHKNLEKSQFLQKLLCIKNAIRDQTLFQDSVELIKCHEKRKRASESTQKRYLFNRYYLLPALEKIIQESLNELKGLVDLKVDSNFVQKVFDTYFN